MYRVISYEHPIWGLISYQPYGSALLRTLQIVSINSANASQEWLNQIDLTGDEKNGRLYNG